jgi:outer membrane lipoprotein LolB
LSPIRPAWAAALAVLLLSSCSWFVRQEGAVSGRPTAERFELNGRVAVRFEGDGYSGSLRWRHADNRDRVELYGPAGLLYARLSRDADGASMEMSDGRRFQEADAGALSRSVLGWELPLQQLRHWVFARPAPDSAPTKFDVDGDGRPKVLEQDGWKVSYLAYSPVGVDVLPSRMDLEYEGLKVRLIIASWNDP